jgi:hypothetical protein
VKNRPAGRFIGGQTEISTFFEHIVENRSSLAENATGAIRSGGTFLDRLVGRAG